MFIQANTSLYGSWRSHLRNVLVEWTWGEERVFRDRKLHRKRDPSLCERYTDIQANTRIDRLT